MGDDMSFEITVVVIINMTTKDRHGLDIKSGNSNNKCSVHTMEWKSSALVARCSDNLLHATKY